MSTKRILSFMAGFLMTALVGAAILAAQPAKAVLPAGNFSCNRDLVLLLDNCGAAGPEGSARECTCKYGVEGLAVARGWRISSAFSGGGNAAYIIFAQQN